MTTEDLSVRLVRLRASDGPLALPRAVRGVRGGVGAARGARGARRAAPLGAGDDDGGRGVGGRALEAARVEGARLVGRAPGVLRERVPRDAAEDAHRVGG